MDLVWESSDDCELMGHNRSPYSRNDDLFLGIKIMQTKWSKSKETNLQSCNFSRPSYLKKHSLDKEIFGGPSSFMSKAPNSSTKYCKVQLYKRFACHAIFPDLTFCFSPRQQNSRLGNPRYKNDKCSGCTKSKNSGENTYNFAAQMICCWYMMSVDGIPHIFK